MLCNFSKIEFQVLYLKKKTGEASRKGYFYAYINFFFVDIYAYINLIIILLYLS
jgi:hypothetical protein